MPSSAAHDPSDASSDEEITAKEDDSSQACFVLRSGGSKNTMGCSVTNEQSPKKSTTCGKRKRAAKQDMLLFMPPSFTDEPDECGVWRMEAFQITWKNIEESIKEVFEVHNTKVFRQIQKFVHDTLFCDAQLELYLSPKTSKSASTCSSARVSKQLHAALLYLRNVDSSDHTTTFIELKNYLKKHDCHVANLLPHNFSSKAGVGAPLYSMMKQIVKISPDTADMDILTSWHRDAANVKFPIVIIIEDAELCNSMVLTDFIVILSEWIVALPLVLILGMATSREAMQKLLPASAARRLHVHTFTLPSPNEYLEGIIKGVLLNPTLSFDIGCDALRFLLSHYQKYDSTVTSFLRALKMACMEHFLSQPLSFLCTKPLEPSNQTHLEEVSNSLKGTLLQYASMLPSVKSKQFDDGHDIGKEIAMALCMLKEQKGRLSTTLHCLLTAGKLLGMDFLKILSEILELQTQKILPNYIGHESVISNGDGFRMGHHEYTSAITSLLKKMRDAPEPTIQSVLTKWMKLTENLTEWRVEIQALLHKLTSETLLESVVEDSSNGCNGSLKSKNLLSSVEETFKEEQGNMALNAEVFGIDTARGIHTDHARIDVESDQLNVHRMVGNLAMRKKLSSKVHGKMATNLLEQMMREHLTPLESLPFHEIICHSNVAAIKQALIGEPRRIIERNVQYAQTTLQCECCRLNDGGDLSGSMNDSSILFCLAQKHGDQANLFDLYQSFDNVLCRPIGEEQVRKKKGQKSPKKVLQKKKVDRTLVQARFCKAASELQLVGLFRMPSKKRSDSVQLAAI